MRLNASGLPEGNYEYRALMTTAAGVTSLSGSGTLGLAAQPLAVIAIPLGFALGLARPEPWALRLAIPRPQCRAGVPLSPGGQHRRVGNTHRHRPGRRQGRRRPIRHRCRHVRLRAAVDPPRRGRAVRPRDRPNRKTGFQPPRVVPPANLPVIEGVAGKMGVIGGTITGTSKPE